MAIYNTPRLTASDIDTMNAGLRVYMVPVGERDTLAKFYGVGVRTVERWFAPEGQQYRRCVPLRDNAISGRLGAENRRIFQMFDTTNKSGWGKANKPDQPLQNMRLRIFLAASLGVQDGLQREPIYHGNQRLLEEGKGSLSACVERINAIYTNNAVYFLYKAWTGFTIKPINGGNGNNWLLTIRYNTIADGDESDDEEEATGGEEIE